MIITTAIACLALNIYHEARSEPVMGRYAVAMVTMNRADGDKHQVCAEVFKRKQFSWTTGVHKTKAGWVIPQHLQPNLTNPIEATGWWYAQRIASVSLSGRMHDFTKGADHYHADYVRPAWAAGMRQVIKLGKHIFYVRTI